MEIQTFVEEVEREEVKSVSGREAMDMARMAGAPAPDLDPERVFEPQELVQLLSDRGFTLSSRQAETLAEKTGIREGLIFQVFPVTSPST